MWEYNNMQMSSSMTKDVTPFRVLPRPQEHIGFQVCTIRSRTRLDSDRFWIIPPGPPALHPRPPPFEISQQTRGSVGCRLHTAGWATQHLLPKDFVISYPFTCLLKKLNLGKH